MTDDVVLDDEVLYRCVFFGEQYYVRDGELISVSSQAFADRGEKPSLDRACLCGSNPFWTQKDKEKDAVVSLIAGEIRKINEVVQNDAKGKPILVHKIDVVPRPVEGNPAHAQVEPRPEYQSKSIFRKLLAQLAFIANARIKEKGWEIPPFELRER